MKKLHSACIALFIVFAAQAQTITMQTLVGSWVPAQIIMNGTTVDLEKNQVTLSADMVNDLKDTDQDEATVKAALLEEFSGFKDIFTVKFETGIINRFEDGATVAAPITIIEENGKQFLYIDKKEKNFIALQNGMLVLSPSAEAADEFKIILRKQ
ncbi:MAG: hypothetical protein V4581_15000 [Bacteroidota bacterium]